MSVTSQQVARLVVQDSINQLSGVKKKEVLQQMKVMRAAYQMVGYKYRQGLYALAERELGK